MYTIMYTYILQKLNFLISYEVQLSLLEQQSAVVRDNSEVLTDVNLTNQ